MRSYVHVSWLNVSESSLYPSPPNLYPHPMDSFDMGCLLDHLWHRTFHMGCLLAWGIGQMGAWCIWWSIEIDHAWDAKWVWFSDTLGDIGEQLRTAPTLFGLPLPAIPSPPDSDDD